MKLVFILPYFGKFPNYFDLYLKSIAFNKNYTWLIVTDCKDKYDFPENVILVYKTFEELKIQFQSNFDFKLSLDFPYKLCDFKPAYGYLFEDYIKDYDYWAHCDSDVIFGNISSFIDFEKLNNYDKIFTLGHLSIYRNESENNSRFLEKIDGLFRYQKVFSNPIAFGFDEQYSGSINTIFLQNNYPLYSDNFAADIDPYHTNFRLNIQNFEHKNYSLENMKKQIFVWQDGGVFRYYVSNNELVKEEYMYIHLQKRSMEINIGNKEGNILIVPNQFKSIDEEITITNFNNYFKGHLFNKQYFAVKYKSFKYKLKHRRHFYSFLKF
jgi:hypothetical protein